MSFKIFMREFFFPRSPRILVYNICHVSFPLFGLLWALLLLYYASSDGGFGGVHGVDDVYGVDDIDDTEDAVFNEGDFVGEHSEVTSGVFEWFSI